MNSNDDRYKVILLEAIEILKRQGENDAGTIEGQNPWQVLNGIKSMAEILEFPLAEIELEGYDIDAILNVKKK